MQACIGSRLCVGSAAGRRAPQLGCSSSRRRLSVRCAALQQAGGPAAPDSARSSSGRTSARAAPAPRPWAAPSAGRRIAILRPSWS